MLVKCDFNTSVRSCDSNADYTVTFPDGHVRYLCKNHIGDRLEKINKPVLVNRLIINR